MYMQKENPAVLTAFIEFETEIVHEKIIKNSFSCLTLIFMTSHSSQGMSGLLLKILVFDE